MLTEVLQLTDQITSNVIYHDHDQSVFITNDKNEESSSSQDIKLLEANTPKDLMKANVHVVDASYSKPVRTERHNESGCKTKNISNIQKSINTSIEENNVALKNNEGEGSIDFHVSNGHCIENKHNEVGENSNVVVNSQKPLSPNLSDEVKNVNCDKCLHQCNFQESALESKMKEYADIIEEKYLNKQVKSKKEEEEIQRKLDVILKEMEVLKNNAVCHKIHHSTPLTQLDRGNSLLNKELITKADNNLKISSNLIPQKRLADQRASVDHVRNMKPVVQTPVPRKSVPQPSTEVKSTLPISPTKPKMSAKGYALLQELLKESPTKHKRRQLRNHSSQITKDQRYDHFNVDGLTTKINDLQVGLQSIIKESSSLKNKLKPDNMKKDLSPTLNDVRHVNHSKLRHLEDEKTMDNIKVYDFTQRSRVPSHAPNDVRVPLHVPNDVHSLKNEKISGFLLEHSLSEICPLDKYLNENRKPKEDDRNTCPQLHSNEDDVIHNAKNVLKELDINRRKLETNLEELQRQRNHADAFCSSNQGSTRLKKLVDEKIKTIRPEIEKQLKENIPESISKKESKTGKKRIPLYLRNYSKPKEKTTLGKDNGSNKEKQPTKPKKPVKKRTLTQQQSEIPGTPPKSSSAYDDLVFMHIYGRQPYHAQRHTLKEHLPSSHPEIVQTNTQSNPIHHTIPNQQTNNNLIRQQFFFHPNNQIVDGISGDMIPIAIPLAEPCTDPSKRLPLVVEGESDTRTDDYDDRKHKGKVLSKAGPNVAVISVKADHLSDISSCSETKQRLKSKVSERVRKKMRLCKQPLPHVDIDTTDTSTTSIPNDTLRYPITNVKDKSLQTSIPASSPSKLEHAPDDNDVSKPVDPSEYNFQDFFYINEVGAQHEEQTSEADSTLQHNEIEDVLEIHGILKRDSPRPKSPSPVKVGVPEEHVRKSVIPDIQDVAQQWLEDELLAKIICSMKEKADVDPTLIDRPQVYHDESQQSDSSDETDDWIERFLGLQGMRFFIDAGVPFDKHIIEELIRDVIIEMLETMFGYPKPVPGDGIQNDDISTKQDSEIEVIPTPIQTPDTSHSKSVINTPNKSISDLEEQELSDLILDNRASNEENFTLLQEDLIKTPEKSVELPSSSLENRRHPTPQASITLKDETEQPIDDAVVSTPDHTVVDDIVVFPQDDFVPSEQSSSNSPTNDDVMQREELDVTPQVTAVVTTRPSTKSLSTATETYSMSTSTAVGLSTFEGMSVGEHLHPSQVLSDYNGSEGEYNKIVFPTLQETLQHDISDLSDGTSRSIGEQMKKLISNTTGSVHPPTRSILAQSEGEINFYVNNDNKSDGEFFHPHLLAEEDTFDLLTSQDERIRHDPVVKVLRKVSMNKEKSEGEMSIHSHGEVIPQHSEENSLPRKQFDVYTTLSKNTVQTKRTTFAIKTPKIINVVSTTAHSRDDIDLERSEVELDENSIQSTVQESGGSSRIENSSDLSIGEPFQETIDNEAEESKGKIDIVLRMPTVEEEYTEDDISQYDLSNISGGDI